MGCPDLLNRPTPGWGKACHDDPQTRATEQPIETGHKMTLFKQEEIHTGTAFGTLTKGITA